MNLMSPLKTWWQRQTGEDETPFDGDTPVCLVSLVFHLFLIVGLALIPLEERMETTLMVTPPEQVEEEPELLELPEDFTFDDVQHEEIGAISDHDIEQAMAMAPIESLISESPSIRNWKSRILATLPKCWKWKWPPGPTSAKPRS